MSKKLSGLLNNEFARLYCKEIGVVPDEYSARWASWTVTSPDILITYKIKEKQYEERIDIMDALNLISKHILKNTK